MICFSIAGFSCKSFFYSVSGYASLDDDFGMYVGNVRGYFGYWQYSDENGYCKGVYSPLIASAVSQPRLSNSLLVVLDLVIVYPYDVIYSSSMIFGRAAVIVGVALGWLLWALPIPFLFSWAYLSCARKKLKLPMWCKVATSISCFFLAATSVCLFAALGSNVCHAASCYLRDAVVAIPAAILFFAAGIVVLLYRERPS
jgi:hypothetical protein